MLSRFVLGSLVCLSVNAHAAFTIDTNVRLIGGYQPQGADSLSPDVQQITQSAAWRQASAQASMAATMKNSPGYFSNVSAAKMASWFAANARSSYNTSRKIMYLFGGADVMYPNVLFPNQDRLMIVGLETPGQIFDAQQMATQGTLASQMNAVGVAWKDLVQISFFITKHMSSELQQFGTSTMIAVGLVARGNTIVSEQAVSLDRNGQLVNGTAGRIRGVQIVYRKPSGAQADVLYFGMDLSDANLRARPEFAAFVKSEAFDTAYYKAASYVSHDQGFINLNRLVLGTVSHVIESDDGIPMSSLRENAAPWSLQLFGIYSQPSPLFGSHTDEDLLSAYDQAICASNDTENLAVWKRQWKDACQRPRINAGFSSVTWGGVLPFRYGYTWQTSASGVKSKFSNLLVLDRVP